MNGPGAARLSTRLVVFAFLFTYSRLAAFVHLLAFGGPKCRTLSTWMTRRSVTPEQYYWDKKEVTLLVTLLVLGILYFNKLEYKVIWNDFCFQIVTLANRNSYDWKQNFLGEKLPWRPLDATINAVQFARCIVKQRLCSREISILWTCYNETPIFGHEPST